MNMLGLPDEQHVIIITSNAATLQREWPVQSVIYPLGDANQDCMLTCSTSSSCATDCFRKTPAMPQPTSTTTAPSNLEDLIEVRNNLGAECEE